MDRTKQSERKPELEQLYQVTSYGVAPVAMLEALHSVQQNLQSTPGYDTVQSQLESTLAKVQNFANRWDGAVKTAASIEAQFYTGMQHAAGVVPKQMTRDATQARVATDLFTNPTYARDARPVEVAMKSLYDTLDTYLSRLDKAA